MKVRTGPEPREIDADAEFEPHITLFISCRHLVILDVPRTRLTLHFKQEIAVMALCGCWLVEVV